MTTKNREPINSGIVSQCEVADCAYNQEKQCNAGAVYFNFLEGKANCYTYTSDSLPEDISGLKGAGQVVQCSVIDCDYNEVQACIADSITVSSSDKIAKCDRYIIANSDRQ